MQQDLTSSISKALKALEYSEKTDSRLYTGALYGALIIAHAFAEDIAHVDEYYQRLMNLPKHILSNAPTQIYLNPTLGVYYAAKKEFEKSTRYFNESFAVAKSVFPNPFMEVSTKQLFGWALGKQGKIEEAKVQLEEAQKIIETTQKRFSHANIQPSLMTLKNPQVNETFSLRLDLVNVSTSQGTIDKIENLLARQFEVLAVSPHCLIHDGQIEFKNNRIGAFEVKTIKLTLKATNSAEKTSVDLNPQITYIDDLGETKTCNPKPLTIAIQTKSNSPSELFRDTQSESDDEIDILKKFGLSRSAGKNG